MKEVEISLQDVYSLFMRKFRWIAVITALSIVAATLFTLFFTTLHSRRSRLRAVHSQVLTQVSRVVLRLSQRM